MPLSTTLLLVRHGETTDNAERRPRGQGHGALNELGLAQADAIGRRLARVEFSHLYSSDLHRAEQTARAIASLTGHEMRTCTCLRERHFGVWQGQLWSEIKTTYPETWAAYHAGDPDMQMPDGESTRQLQQRSVECLEAIARQNPGEQIVVVTHGGVINSLLRHTLGIPLGQPKRFESQNASLNIFRFEADRWFLETWGDVSHLAGLGEGAGGES